MTTELERSYARLLRLYPAGYRRARGDEMLDVLLSSGATRLSLRERRALVLGALRARAGAAGHRDLGAIWRQSAALAAAMLMTFGTVGTVQRQLDWPVGDWREYVAAALGLAGIVLTFSRWLPAAIGCAAAAYLFPMLSEGRLSFSWSMEWLLAAILLIPVAVRGGLMLTIGPVNQGVAELYGVNVETSYVMMWALWPAAMLVVGSLVARRRSRI